MGRKGPGCTISRSKHDAVLFDLDGVVTKTAKVHAAAWKILFDEYLKRREGESFRPFDIDLDYRRYVDGKPRYDGVKSFLESRGIYLPYGSPDDPPGLETVCGLGNRKNQVFHLQLERSGVEVYESTVALIRDLRSRGFRTAIVSSSKNCKAVLEAAGIEGLFDARVDGVVSAKEGLTGKPAPDIFLEAARRLGVERERAVVVEDAISGVEAGRRGGFCVIGVDRTGEADALLSRGADVVVRDLEEVSLGAEEGSTKTTSLPSAIKRVDEIFRRAEKRRIVVFLDYDGTITPIVERPEEARLSEQMLHALRALAKRFTVAVVSGRDLADVRDRVGIEEIFYAGSHGFDISGPTGLRLAFEKGTEYLPELDRAEKDLRRELSPIPGSLVERKRFSIAVHYRRVREEDLNKLERTVAETSARYPNLRMSSGKKIYELQPNIDWNKGKALLWLLDAMGLREEEVLPVYIGDDTTDEDAFEVLKDQGIGIIVLDGPRNTAARYALDDPEEVRSFLDRLSREERGTKG